VAAVFPSEDSLHSERHRQRSLYQYRFLIRACDEFGFRLAEEFFWFNPAKLPSPIEWVNKRKLRAKDAVNTVWWLSKSDNPKADVSRVLSPYSERMKALLRNAQSFYLPKKRPSGHDISEGFGRAGEGAIPSNLLQIPNTESNSPYLRLCRLTGATGHPARFPRKLPEFFIKFLTTEGDTVLDFFAGSNTTGAAAQALKRRWIAFELEPEYVASSAFRFVDPSEAESAKQTYEAILGGKRSLALNGFTPPEKIRAKVNGSTKSTKREASLFAQ
jgi:hypothetical protein